MVCGEGAVGREREKVLVEGMLDQGERRSRSGRGSAGWVEGWAWRVGGWVCEEGAVSREGERVHAQCMLRRDQRVSGMAGFAGYGGVWCGHRVSGKAW